MAVYRIGGRSVATAATANHAYAQLWNPHTTSRIDVQEIHIAVTAAVVSNYGLLRSPTTRGTAGSTVTPTIESSDGRDVAPPSGTLLDLAAFTAQPALASATAYMNRWNLPAAIGAGMIWVFGDPIKVPPLTGLVVVTPVAVIGQPIDITFVWSE